MEHALAGLAVEPRLPVVVVLAVDNDSTVFIMLNLIVAIWMTLVVLASWVDSTVGNARLANGALASAVIVLILSITAPPAQDREQALPDVDSTRNETDESVRLTFKLPEHVLTILDSWAALDAQATARKFLRPWSTHFAPVRNWAHSAPSR
jgi:hypothetical protein